MKEPAKSAASGSRYFKAGKRGSVSKQYPDVYLVLVEDRLLGPLYCTLDEAITAQELQEISTAHRSSHLAQITPIDRADVPGKVLKQLDAIAAATNEED